MNLVVESSGTGSAPEWRQKPEGSCPGLLLSSCVLRYPCEFLGAKVVVLPVITDVQHFWEISYVLGEFGYGELWYRVSSRVQTETRKILSPADPWFLCPNGSVRIPLGPGI